MISGVPFATLSAADHACGARCTATCSGVIPLVE
jgi:hypothetical protein